MKKLVLYWLCLGMLAASPAIAEDAKAAAERGEAIRVVDAWLDSVQVYRRIPAISAAIVVGDKTDRKSVV